MSNEPFSSLEACFGDLPDPRAQGRCEHKLVEIILVAVCAVLCGAESWSEVEEFGEAKETWLRQYLELAGGIPSHEPFSRVFRLLDAGEFQRRFMRWVEQYFHVPRGEVIAIDGKTARGSSDRMSGQDAIHLVSAWASEVGILLGQRKIDSKSNEITAVPELLNLQFIKGCIVMVDALNCQKDIARTLVERHADYVFALKANYPQLHQDVMDWFDWARARNFRDVIHDFHQTVNKGHGRLEIRRCWAIYDPLALESMGHYQGWAGLHTVVMVERERRQADQIQRETVYYLSSLPPDAARILAATCAHWSVENTFHWTMDGVFGEDRSRIHNGESADNMAMLRSTALNLLKRDTSRSSLRQKRFRASMDNDFLLQFITQF